MPARETGWSKPGKRPPAYRSFGPLDRTARDMVPIPNTSARMPTLAKTVATGWLLRKAAIADTAGAASAVWTAATPNANVNAFEMCVAFMPQNLTIS